jgi:hypothetical protein
MLSEVSTLEFVEKKRLASPHGREIRGPKRIRNIAKRQKTRPLEEAFDKKEAFVSLHPKYHKNTRKRVE